MYLMFGPNHILVSLSWDERHSLGHKNICRWFSDTDNYWDRQN